MTERLPILALLASMVTAATACGGQTSSTAGNDSGTSAEGTASDGFVEPSTETGVPPDATPADSGAADADGGIDAEGGNDANQMTDAGDASVCDPSVVGWSPSALTGLVLWLDAARGIASPAGSRVAQWLDQSAAHNDATQSSSYYQPTLVPTSIGGLPAVRFDGNVTFLSIADSSTLQWGTGDFSVFVVALFSTSMGTTTQMLYQKSPPSAPWNGPALYVDGNKPMQDTTVTSQLSQYVFATSSRDGLQGSPHLFGGRRNGAMLEVRLDGDLVGQAMMSGSIDVSAQGQPAMIGQNGYNPMPGFQALQGDIAEMIGIQGTISDSDLRTLECHLRLKYGL